MRCNVTIRPHRRIDSNDYTAYALGQAGKVPAIRPETLPQDVAFFVRLRDSRGPHPFARETCTPVCFLTEQERRDWLIKDVHTGMACGAALGTIAGAIATTLFGGGAVSIGLACTFGCAGGLLAGGYGGSIELDPS